jgi:hypothetical protein
VAPATGFRSGAGNRRFWGAAKPRGVFSAQRPRANRSRGEGVTAPLCAAIRVIFVVSAKIASFDGKIQQKIKGKGQR